MFRGCDLGPWRQERPANALVAQVAQAGGFTVNRRVDFVGVRISGQGGAPVVRVTGPGGAVFDTPAGAEGVQDANHVTTRVDALGETFLFIRRPARGRWTITPTGGAPITRVSTSLPVARPRVRARVQGRGRGARTLRYRVRRIPGQRVTFIERGRGVAHRLGTTRGGRGKLRFRPARRGSPQRQVIAQVTQSGLPRANLRVARFRAAAPRRPARVRRIALRRARGAVRVRWARAARAHRYYVTVRVGGRTLQRGVRARRALALGHLAAAPASASRSSPRRATGPSRGRRAELRVRR